MSDATLGWIVIGAMGSLPLAATAVMWRLKPLGIWKAGQNDDRGGGGGGCGGGCGGG